MAADLSSSAKDASRIARLPGVSSAPPMPISTRAASSVPIVGAAAAATLATPNTTVPST